MDQVRIKIYEVPDGKSGIVPLDADLEAVGHLYDYTESEESFLTILKMNFGIETRLINLPNFLYEGPFITLKNSERMDILNLGSHLGVFGVKNVLLGIYPSEDEGEIAEFDHGSQCLATVLPFFFDRMRQWIEHEWKVGCDFILFVFQMDSTGSKEEICSFVCICPRMCLGVFSMILFDLIAKAYFSKMDFEENEDKLVNISASLCVLSSQEVEMLCGSGALQLSSHGIPVYFEDNRFLFLTPNERMSLDDEILSYFKFFI
jgi:hypothetical protein